MVAFDLYMLLSGVTTLCLVCYFVLCYLFGFWLGVGWCGFVCCLVV